MSSNDLTTNKRPSETNQKWNAVADPCVHCGFCLPTCASYRVLGTEMDSPRGRIHTLKAIENGEIKLDSTVTSHFDTCLGCFACVTACPSGVRYDQIIEAARPLLNQPGLRTPCDNFFRALLLKLLPYPQRLRAVLQTVRAYSGSTIQDVARGLGIIRLFGPQIEAMEALLPTLSKESFKDSFPIINRAHGETRGRVGLVLGCVQRCFDPSVNQATIAVLQANGWEVIIPKNQGCCGAVAHHQGQMEQTKLLAKELIKSFSSVIRENLPAEEKPLEAVLVAASGCGHTMKAFKAITENEESFDAPVFDVHEFLFQKGLSSSFHKTLKPLLHKDGTPSNSHNPISVVYHDACHMIHGQGISKEPRQLLQKIPHLIIKEVQEPGVCCGSAGIYNLVQPKEAAELGQIKTKDLTGTGAEIILSANIGCTLQIRRHINKNLLVAHPMQILAQSAGLH